MVHLKEYIFPKYLDILRTFSVLPMLQKEEGIVFKEIHNNFKYTYLFSNLLCTWHFLLNSLHAQIYLGEEEREATNLGNLQTPI